MYTSSPPPFQLSQEHLIEHLLEIIYLAQKAIGAGGAVEAVNGYHGE